MNKFLITTLLMIMSTTSFTKTVGHDGNGGAGVVKNGKHMSFYSAGFYIEPVSKKNDDIPMLNQTIDVIMNSNLSDLMKMEYHKALLPSHARNYFKIDEASFDQSTKQRLIKEYKKNLKIADTEIKIFAVTDIKNKTTYLLPSFYDLSPSDQQAILYHESYWILNPDAEYTQVIEIEMSFQAYISQKQCLTRELSWISKADGMESYIKTLLAHDLSNNYIDEDFIFSGLIVLSKVYSPDWFSCLKSRAPYDCKTIIFANLMELKTNNPKSKFIAMLFSKFQEEKISLIVALEKFSSKTTLRQAFTIDKLGEDQYYSSQVLVPAVLELLASSLYLRVNDIASESNDSADFLTIHPGPIEMRNAIWYGTRFRIQQ